MSKITRIISKYMASSIFLKIGPRILVFSEYKTITSLTALNRKDQAAPSIPSCSTRSHNNNVYAGSCAKLKKKTSLGLPTPYRLLTKTNAMLERKYPVTKTLNTFVLFTR